MFRRIFCALAFALAAAAPAHGAQLCAWLVETPQPDHVRALDMWLQSDSRMDFQYAIDGKGLVSAAGESNAPAHGSYSLRPQAPVKVWHFASTFYPPGRIDLDLEIRKVPTDYFGGPTTVLATFAFARRIPSAETAPSPDLAKKQCAEIFE